MYYLTSYIILITIFLSGKSDALDVCGLEDVKICEISDASCQINFGEPRARLWFIYGRKEYFLPRIDPLPFDELALPVNDKVYKLLQVKITGYDKLQLKEWKMDIKNGSFQYDYEYKLDVTAEQFLDDKGNSLVGNKPFVVHLVNTYAITTLNVEIIKRCDDKQFFHFWNSHTTVREVTDDNVVYENDLQAVDRKAIDTALATVVTKAANMALERNWRLFTSIIPVTAYWKI